MKGGKVSAKELKQFIDASYEKHAPEKIGDYILDKELSKATGKVYHNPKTGETKVVHRGTEGTLKDWTNNLAYATGLYEHTHRYKQGKRMQERAEAKYNPENIDTLGHSQGSVLSSKLGKKTKNVINLNPAYRGEATEKNVTNIRSSGDVVSALLNPVNTVRKLFGKKNKGKTVSIKAETKNPLKEHSSDILEREGEAVYGGSFFKDFARGFKQGFTGTADIATGALTGNPEKIKEGFNTVTAGARVRKARGKPHFELRVGGRLHSTYQSRREANKVLKGGGFLDDFGRSFKKSFNGTADMATGMVTGNPEKIKSGFNDIGDAYVGKGRNQDIKLYGKMLSHLENHIIDIHEPVDSRDFIQAKELIDAIKRKKMRK